MASTVVGTGRSQSQQDGWRTFVTHFNDLHSNQERLALIFNTMKGDSENGTPPSDTCTWQGQRAPVTVNLTDIAPGQRDLTTYFIRRYQDFRASDNDEDASDNDEDEIKLEFDVKEKKAFSTRQQEDHNQSSGGKCVIRLKKTINPEVDGWCAPIFVNRLTGEVTGSRALRSSETFYFVYGNSLEERGCGCQWCNKVKDNERGEDGIAIKNARLNLPILRRNRINQETGADPLKSTTCYKYLLCTQIMILLMNQGENESTVSNNDEITIEYRRSRGRFIPFIVTQVDTRRGPRNEYEQIPEERLTLLQQGNFLIQLPSMPEGSRL